MKKATILTAITLLAIISVRADVIFQETFNYTNGSIIITGTNGTGSSTVTNWIRHGSNAANPPDSIVNNHRMEVDTSSTYLGETVTRIDDINRQFATTAGSQYTNAHQLVYASFIVNFTNLPTANGAYFAHFHFGLPTSTSFEGRLWALAGNPAQPTNNFSALPNTFRLGVSANNGSSPIGRILALDLALNTDYQVILGWDPVTLLAATVWVNPISSSDPSVTSGDVFTPSALNIANSFAFRQASGFGGFLTASNLVVATTFIEALTNGMPTNAVSPRIVSQPVGVTNFVGATVSLSAVAVGQGQASLTYQWYQGTAPYANPGGNTNVLTFVNAQVTDSSNYTVVVTTPYGLSVTSSVAKVLISSAPVPPAFITQPVSQTVYRGQNVVFSTTVSSPGNVTYQWKSNNVDIAGETGSTLTINNVTVAISGSQYRVGVTNDVVANGILSTNAVLTVLNPPVVSIAYLRTLVDPVTFQSTNSPATLPYQVTGIITTFTNQTSGNTASYYLQDATAGINIFATFGSTFRPQLGDQVTFIGVVSSFAAATGGLELFADTVNRTYTSYSVTGSGPLPTPRTIPFTVTNTYGYAYVATNLAGSLVTLTNVYFGTNAGNLIATVNQAVIVTNASGDSITLEFFGTDLNTAGQPMPAFATSVTGVLIGNHPNYLVAVSRYSDIVVPPPAPIPLGLSYSGGTLTFNWTDASFSLQSATNVLGPYTTVTGAATGFTTNTTSDQMYFRLFHP